RQGGKVEWLYTGETFNSLTALTKHICQEELGKSYSIQGPAYWGKDGVTLYDMAKQIGTAEVAGAPGYAVALPAAVPVTPAPYSLSSASGTSAAKTRSCASGVSAIHTGPPVWRTVRSGGSYA